MVLAPEYRQFVGGLTPDLTGGRGLYGLDPIVGQRIDPVNQMVADGDEGYPGLDCAVVAPPDVRTGGPQGLVQPV